jgi:hypothetical protein
LKIRAASKDARLSRRKLCLPGPAQASPAFSREWVFLSGRFF